MNAWCQFACLTSLFMYLLLRKISYSKFKVRSVVFKYVGQCLSLSTEQNQVGIPTKLQNVTKNPPVKNELF